MSKFQYSLFLSFALSLSSCRSVKGDQTALSVPYFKIQCDSQIVELCGTDKSGTQVYVGLVADQVDCKDRFQSQPGNQEFYQDYDASGSAPLDREARFLVAEISQWRTWANLPVTNLPQGTYTACAFIDSDGDRRWTFGEPFSGLTFQLNFQSIEIKDWR